ncbi:nucleolar protein 12 [Aricia agestis]|uniref:nucleolar protein 12 n=1 Tax=Aricia agestis TaxID=91739 RepID=UPI001C20A11A|nr:nucleolar protein 12 [Aricia agestis]
MAKKRNKNADRKKKVNLVFDEAKRKDFLCGFRKRKLERKKKAQEEIQRLLKEEKRRIKQENKESYKKLVVSSRPLPDIEQLLQEEYEDEDVNVKILELSSDTLQKKDIVIGENRPREPKKPKENKSPKQNGLPKEVPGMEINEESSNEQSESENESDDGKLKTKKEVKKLLKHQATKKLQKSKVFQMKSKLDRIQHKKSQKKKAKTQEKKEKSKKKNHRKKHK